MKHFSYLCSAVIISLSLSGCSQEPVTSPGREYTRHKYWDGKKAAPIKDVSCVDQRRKLFEAYGRPELMAIGDSLYNGVQSLRINWWLSEWSVPSLVAISMGLIKERNADRTGVREFYGPQYPDHGNSPSHTRSYGFNLEALPGLLGYNNIIPDQRSELRDLAFDYVPDNGRIMVDNLSFSGANSIDMIDVKAKSYRNAAADFLDGLTSPADFNGLSNAFFYSNAYFVLNPTKNHCIDQMTVIDQVEFRKPKRLLVNIGSNNGLYRIAFLGKSLSSGKPYEKPPAKQSTKDLIALRDPNVSIKEFIERVLLQDLNVLISRLSAIDGLEEVYINNLALPSQPANMVPTRDGFASALFKSDVVSSKDMKANDEVVAKVNAGLRNRIEMANRNRVTGPSFIYVDVAKVLERYDYKACIRTMSEAACASKRFKLPGEMLGFRDGRTLYFDNRPMKAVGARGYNTGVEFSAKLSQGGLFSFDNMHLSTIGYELMAQAVWKSMPSEALAKSLRPLTIDRCPNPGSKNFGKANEGDCVPVLVTPGYSAADINRREFNFVRVAGERDTNRSDLLSFLSGFVN